MQTLPLTDLKSFLSEPMWDTKNMVYRGVSNSSYSLISSIGRLSSETPTGLVRYEREIFAEFQRRALAFMDRRPRSQLEWLFLAQHYGVPTRLLDWTTNPLIALYFACAEERDSNFAVYKNLHASWLDSEFTGDPFLIDAAHGVRPPHSDVRFVAQEGVFTIHPRPIEPYRDPYITKYVFPSSQRGTIRWQLRKLGFGPSRIFPGLDGLALDLKDELDYHLHHGSVRGSGAVL